jgi:hypothetical protein
LVRIQDLSIATTYAIALLNLGQVRLFQVFLFVGLVRVVAFPLNSPASLWTHPLPLPLRRRFSASA